MHAAQGLARPLALALALLVAFAVADMDGRVGRKSALVILGDSAPRSSVSNYLTALEKLGYNLTVVAERESIKERLVQYHEYQYGNLIVVAPQSSSIGGLKTEALLEFLDAGGNLLVALDDHPSGFMRYFAGQCGVEVDDKAEPVIDHFHFVAGSENHTLISSTGVLENSVIFPAGVKGAVTFEGVGLRVKADNFLNVPILRAESTAYTGVPGAAVDSEPFASGRNLLLATSMQGQNNARVTFLGSTRMLENSQSARNLGFLTQLSTWTFRERGVLRAHGVRHQRADGSQAEIQVSQPRPAELPESMFPMPEIAPNSLFYRILDNVTYQVQIDSYTDGRWSPFQASDVQLEFVMMDPYIRKTLDSNFGVFSTGFTVPDVYGIYKFHLQYRRVGYTTLAFDTEVSVRPFRHNEYERFIGAAAPYYTGVFALMLGYFVFGFVYLYR